MPVGKEGISHRTQTSASFYFSLSVQKTVSYNGKKYKSSIKDKKKASTSFSTNFTVSLIHTRPPLRSRCTHSLLTNQVSKLKSRRVSQRLRCWEKDKCAKITSRADLLEHPTSHLWATTCMRPRLETSTYCWYTSLKKKRACESFANYAVTFKCWFLIC